MSAEALEDQMINSRLLMNFRSTMLKTPKDRRSVGWLKTQLEQLEDLWKDFLNGHKRLMRDRDLEEEEYFTKDIFADTNCAYSLVKTEILDATYPGRNVSSLRADEQCSQIGLEMPSYKNPLPPINLPQFSGQQLEWETFKDMFSALVHDVPSIPPILKLQYLLRSLTGDAANQLKNVQITAENYLTSWQTLQERYDNKKALLFSHMSHIVSCPAMQKRSLDEIRELLDVVRESKNAMDNLHIQPEQLSELWLIHHVVSKFDHSTRLDWEREADRSDHFPTYKELNGFLERSIRIFEAAGPCTSTNNNRLTKSAPTKPKQTSVYATNVQTTRSSGQRACVLCQGTHSLYSCRKFLALSQPQRYELCRREKLCLNCLQSSHFVRDCPSDKRCFTCGGKHHTKLHSEAQAPRDSAGIDQRSIGNNDTNSAAEETQMSAYHANPANYQASNGMLVILATARVLLQDELGNEIKVRALIDPGSERSFVSERVITAISADTNKTAVAIHVMGGRYSSTVRKEARIVLKSALQEDFKKLFSALVMRDLTGMLPRSQVSRSRWAHLRGLTLADPEFYEPNKVDCVIGGDLLPDIILDGIRTGPDGATVAQRTVFGWIVTGKVQMQAPVQQTSAGEFHVRLEPTLHQIVERFWEVEDMAKKKHLTPEEEYCEDYFCKTTTRTNKGRFIVRLPFSKSSKFPGSRDIAVACLARAERRIAKTPKLDSLYKLFMHEYVQLGHMECVPDDQLSRESFYLPHHAVFRPGDSNKIRVVFSASQKAMNRVALNEVLLPGPKLQKDITSVITRWRFSRFVFATDIVKMFRQILVHPDDVNWQRIVWRFDETKEIKDFRALTVTYGTAPAPFLALRVLQQLADDGRHTYPEAARILDHQVYVDDLFGGGDNVKEAIDRRNQLVHLLASAGMELGKWSANEIDLLRGVAAGDSEEIAMQLSDVVSTLGLRWSTREDCFIFTVSMNSMPSVITKRNILSDVARLFDPLGWLAPVTITAKIILQDLWMEKVDWDDSVKGELLQRWRRFRASIDEVARLRIPRWFGGNERGSWSLHGFADASKRAYAAAVYLVIAGNSSTLMMAKTRVAPVGRETLPRLELCAATLLVRLTKQLLEISSRQPDEIHFWSDSKVVLDWLKGHPSRWQTFVANRVSEIVNTFPQAKWRHVRSADNAVDCATRGLTPEQLLDSRLWWNGPPWLVMPATDWPTEVLEEDESTATVHVFNVMQELINDQDQTNVLESLKKFSRYTKLTRVLAYCGLWLHKIRARKNQSPYEMDFLTADELEWAHTVLCKMLQKQHFAAEIECSQEKKRFHKKSKLARLTVLTDNKGLLRLNGRLHNAPLPYNERHPIILPNDNIIVRRIVEHAHRETKHGGVQLMLSHLQRTFWIENARRLVVRVYHACVRCARFRGRAETQQMAPLPVERLTPQRAFDTAGLDYAGPISVLFRRGRGARRTKGYVAIFICLVLKAVHIEIVSDLTTRAFLAAYDRFAARRGVCSTLYSDNATTFKGASSELKRMFREASSFHTTVAGELAMQGTDWKFIPPRAPHFGGLWEAAVKSFKFHLKRVIGDNALTFEELSTLAAKIEACLNSRPLCRISSQPDDLVALTPAHFLVGTDLLSVPENYDVSDKQSFRDRWQLLSQMRNAFWYRWRKEVMHQLQLRNKWLHIQTNLKKGDIVIIKDDLSPPAKWPIGVIVEARPGADGHVRVVTLRTATSVFVRPVVKLIKLPVDVRANEEYEWRNKKN